ncbi:MAG: response regulator [Muribaculaceae bacterium]|nr:response regulator [Muribaculaceae bacterium]
MLRYLLPAIIFAFSLLPGHAINTASHFENISVRGGLSNGFVNDMTLDGQGFLWVATNSGLNRVSGKTVTRFNKSNSGVSGDEFICIYYNRPTNAIWVGTRLEGISVYDINSGKFTTFDTSNGLLGMDIADIIDASDGGIWILTRNQGIQHYDPATGVFENLTRDDYPTLRHNTRCMVDDGAGKLYVAHFGKGVTVIDRKKRKVENYVTDSPGSNGLLSDFVRTIMIDSRQNIWVGTNKGVCMFNPSTRRFSEVPIRGDVIPDNIHDIFETKEGVILLSSDLGEVTQLELDNDNPDGSVYYNVTSVSPSDSSLSSPNVRKVLEDAYGNLWIGHYSTGVDFVYKDQPLFKTDPLTGITGKPWKIYGMGYDRDGNLWLGGENTLVLYRNNMAVRSWDLSPYLNRKKSVVAEVFPDSKGNVWLGINDVGVLKYNPHAGTFERIDLEQPLDVQAFWEDSDGKIWIGTEIGPLNSLFSYKDGVIVSETGYNDKMPRPTLSAIMRDSADRMWIGSIAKGLYVFDKSGKRLARLGAGDGLPSNNINTIFQDSESTVWLGTSEGLVRMEDEDDFSKIKVYDYRNGLPEINIRSICEDHKGNIWVSTYSGISCLKSGRSRFENYDYRDGLPEGGFSSNSVAVADDGTIYWGSIGGLSQFNRQSVNESHFYPRLQLVSFESVDSDDKINLVAKNKGVYYVPYDKNSVRIRFTVDNYAEASKIEYSYMLENLDKDWQFIGNTDELNFKSLPGGHKYKLRLRARMKNGEWNDEDILVVRIQVGSPIWLSWYALLIYGVVAVGVVIFAMYMYRRRLHLHNRMEIQGRTLELERKQRQDEQDLNNERMRFYTNIAHELRTPLTLIIGPLEDLCHDDTLPESVISKVKGIHGSSIRLLNLINQIMEFRKTETQNKELMVMKGSLPDLITEIGLRYKELYKNDKVEFQLSVEKLNTPVYFDREIITTIVNNFISNAIKYTANGHIRLSLDAVMEGDEQYARISVEDTGYGIDAEMLPRIYDRYFQAKGKHQASGTGIGLALVKSLSDLHKGLLKVESRLGVGSTFSFLIRVNEIYPEAEHKEPDKSVAEDLLIDEGAGKDGNRQVILVVEDNAEIRNYISESFKDDFTVLCAADGNEGLELALGNMPDIVISDIMMPGMDGIQLCRSLKEDIRTSHIPVILLTAKDTINDKEEGYESGADSYITKPFSARLLKARVVNLLEGRKRLSRLIMCSVAAPVVAEAPATAPESLPVVASADAAESGCGEVVTVEGGSVPEVAEAAVGVPRLSRLDREFLEKLDHIIGENLSIVKLDMAFLTDNMNMSHSTLYRKVKVLTGMPPADYVKKFKLRKSVELLLSRDYNVTEIAFKTGFNSPEHYRGAFKDEYGMSPTQYFKKHREGH